MESQLFANPFSLLGHFVFSLHTECRCIKEADVTRMGKRYLSAFADKQMRNTKSANGQKERDARRNILDERCDKTYSRDRFIVQHIQNTAHTLKRRTLYDGSGRASCSHHYNQKMDQPWSMLAISINYSTSNPILSYRISASLMVMHPTH